MLNSATGSMVPAPPPKAPVKLKEEADAILYLGPRDSLTSINMTRTELAGTAYENELERRLTIEGFPPDFAAQLEAANSQSLQFLPTESRYRYTATHSAATNETTPDGFA